MKKETIDKDIIKSDSAVYLIGQFEVDIYFLGRDSEFWPLFNCLLMILNRLGPRIWQHINVEKHSDLFYLVVLHPAFLKEVKSLPGYIGQDREVGEGCTVSCHQRLNNKDSAEQRSEKFV